MTTLRINRAPVLTLWASVVAERLGWPPDTALTMGQAVAGMTAHAKGVRLGIFAESAECTHEPPPPNPAGVTGEIKVAPLLGRIVHVAPTKDGPRAVTNGELVKPEAVARYLGNKFGDSLADARHVMEKLAATMPPDKINERGFGLYERFRPEVPSDEKGWGAKGVLDLAKIEALARGAK